MAAALERGCTDDATPDVIDRLLSRTLAALNPVIDSLAPLERRGVRPVDRPNSDRPHPGRRDSDPADPGGAGMKTVRALLTQIEALLEDSNLEAGDVVEELAASVAGTALAETVDDISQAVARFDVDTALDGLRKMARELTESDNARRGYPISAETVDPRRR